MPADVEGIGLIFMAARHHLCLAAFLIISYPNITPMQEPHIDAHCHVWTPGVAHYPLGKGWRVEDMKPPSFTAEELLATCRPAGVGRLNLIQMSFYRDKPEMLSRNPTHIEMSVWNLTRFRREQ